MNRRIALPSRIAVTAVAFLSGAFVMALIDRGIPRVLRAPVGSSRYPSDIALPGYPRVPASRVPTVGTLPDARSALLPVIEAEPLEELRDRHLEVPVHGITRSELRDTFDQARGTSHRHEAIDILAPRHTPILAVEDGSVAKLFVSKAGGTTVYQFDPSERYVYYYAHLDRYADSLHEGDRITRGQVLGYVGTSGNAPKDTPHLHFAIFRLTDKKQWWDGRPIDPYGVLR